MLSISSSVASDSLRPPWTGVRQPLSIGILHARILHWIAMPSSGDVPNPGIEPRAPALQADSLPSEPPGKTNFTSLDNIYQFDLLLQFLLELMLEYISSNTFKPIA